jgi:superfamily II DNA or RNA helicase
MSREPLILAFADGTLTLEGDVPRRMYDELRARKWVWDARASLWRCDAIQYANEAAWLASRGVYVLDDVPRWRPVRWPGIDLPALRPEQTAAIRAWQQTRRGVIVMPTGTGKTEVALSIMSQASVATLVVAPVRDLMYQWHRRIAERLGVDAGVVGDNQFRVKPVCCTTYESACIHMERFGNRFELIVFDECHHLPGPVRRDAARMSAAPLRLGLTATPDHSAERSADLASLIGPVVYELPLTDARGHCVADYDVVRIVVHLSGRERARFDALSNQVRQYMHRRRKEDPHFTWQHLCGEVNQTPEARHALAAYLAKKAIEDRAEEKLRVLEDLFRLHLGERCIVFAGSNAMARDVSQRFLIPCLLSHCRKQERLEVLQGLESGVYPALVANRVLDEGVDLPAVKVAIVIGGLGSERQAKQRLGRVLRKTGPARAVLYEVVTADTTEPGRARKRTRSDAFDKIRHRRG